ncbi:MAG: CrcB family protein [Actinomycetaceae bacterium]|nr:CrcB family protein [Actinomycetaceae bacterium]
MIAWLLLPIAGGLGAYARYRADLALQKQLKRRGLLPVAPGASLIKQTTPAWPIIFINMIGSLAAGLLVGHLAGDAWLVVGTGFLGGWTTFSTAMMDTLQILTGEKKRGAAGLLAALGGLIASVAFAYLGLKIAGV